MVRYRFWEVDAIRGIAIVLMIFYHFMWDLSFFGLSDVHVYSWGWQTFARGIGTTFIFVMGISLVLNDQESRQKSKTQTSLWSKFAWRGLKIFGWGMFITLATFILIGDGFVIFGILHLIGAVMICAYPFLHISPWLTLMSGVLILWIGFGYVETLQSTHIGWTWLGIPQMGRPMVDYYPLIPWFGIALIGIFVGHQLYPNYQRRWNLPDWSDQWPLKGLIWMGQRSLTIYLVHQPIIIGTLILLHLLHIVTLKNVQFL